MREGWGLTEQQLAAAGAAASLVAVGAGSIAVRQSGLPQWWPWGPQVVVTDGLGAVDWLWPTTLWMVALVALVAAWLLLVRRARAGLVTAVGVALVAALWAVPFVLGPPLASRDVFSYAAYGQIAAEGLDPYEVGPGVLPTTPLTAAVDPLWEDTPSVYGPGFLAVVEVTARLAGDDYHATVLLLRLVALVGLGLAGLGVADIARSRGHDPAVAVALVLANPVTLVHLVSGAHNEALMVGLLATGVAAAVRGRWLAGIALTTLGATVKFPALVAAGFIAIWQARATTGAGGRARVVLGGAGVSLALLAGVGIVTGHGFDWLTTLDDGIDVFSYLSITSLLGALVSAPGLVQGLGLAAAAALTVRWLVQDDADPGHLGAALLAIALLGPVVHPHYLVWGGVLLAATATPTRMRWVVAPIVVATFAVLPAAVGPDLADQPVSGLVVACLVVVAAMAVTSRAVLDGSTHGMDATVDVDDLAGHSG